MSRKIHQAPLAVASDGTLLLSVRELDATESLDGLVAAACNHQGAVFVGVALSRGETRRVLGDLTHAHREVAAYVAGARLRTARLRRERAPAKR